MVYKDILLTMIYYNCKLMLTYTMNINSNEKIILNNDKIQL